MNEQSSSSSSIEKNRQNCNIDWRTQKPSFDEQLDHFCSNEGMTDVEFVFNRGGKIITKVPAYSLILSVVSEVFQKEFAYNMPESGTEKRSKTIKVVEIKDELVEIDAFKAMILFCNSAYKNVDLTEDLAIPLLYIAMQYMIKPLEARCVNFLLEHLDQDDSMFFAIFQLCVDLSVDSRLIEKCMTILRPDRSNLLWREDGEVKEAFLKISQKCLVYLLKDDFLEAREEDLFKAALAWAKAACDCDGNGEALRAKLGNALEQIRFPQMSLKEFAKSVVPTGILSAEEQRDILLMIGGESPVGIPISLRNEPRIYDI